MTVPYNQLSWADILFLASVCSGLICWYLQAYTGYFALYLFLCQITFGYMIESLKKGMVQYNNDNAKSVKNHIGTFQDLQQKYETLIAKSSKLEKEHTALQQKIRKADR